MEPSRLGLTALGYQPVGIRPSTRLSSGSGARRITATELEPPLVTYRVRSSGESARLLGLLPLNMPGLGKILAGAVVLMVAARRSFSVLITTTESLLSHAANNRFWALFRRSRFGWPWSLIRLATFGVERRSSTTISRSRMLET